ncbi:MAG: hypothetical protein WA941_00635 [Nitrososphaeraceae archaeon]
MANKRKTIDSDRLTALLKDPVVIKIVTVLDVVSLSILELLEYGISRKDVSYALANEVIMFDKSALIHTDISSNFPLTEQDIIASGDYYFYNFLNSKVKLTELGLYILDTLKGEQFDKADVPPSYGTAGLQDLSH